MTQQTKKQLQDEIDRLKTKVNGLETENKLLKKASSKRGRKEFRRTLEKTAKEAQKKRKPAADIVLEKPLAERIKIAIKTGGAIIAGKRGTK